MKGIMHPSGWRALYEGATPEAGYSPWRVDSAFQTAFSEVAMNTMVDEYRCYELWELVEQSSQLPSGSLLEVGVWRGGTGALIARRAEMSGLADSVYLCDTFSGVVKPSQLDSTYRGGEHGDCSKDDVASLLYRLGLSNCVILEGIFPDETAQQIREPLRFCHVDVDTYRSAKETISWLWPRLVSGGIVVFDDFGFESCDGVTRFVNELRIQPDCHVIHNLNGHAIVVKIR